MTSQPAREDPTKILKKSEKFQKLVKTKKVLDQQKRVISPPKFKMKYRGRSASDVYEDDLPKESMDDEEVQEEIDLGDMDQNYKKTESVQDFEEANVDEGDQNMPVP